MSQFETINAIPKTDRQTHPCLLNLIGSGVEHGGGVQLFVGLCHVLKTWDNLGQISRVRLATEVFGSEEAVLVMADVEEEGFLLLPRGCWGWCLQMGSEYHLGFFSDLNGVSEIQWSQWV